MQPVRSSKFFFVVGFPPVCHVAGGVELTALVVEPVSEFVTDDCADAAKIHRVVRFVVIERRLKNSGWEGDIVLQRVVTGIDS